MNQLTAYYCIVQYRHDLSNPNAVNIGVLLFCPENGFLDAKLTADAHSEAQFFSDSELDLEWIATSKQALLNRLKHDRPYFQTVKDIEDFAARRANEIRITPPKPLSSIDLESELDRLFENAVTDSLAQCRTWSPQAAINHASTPIESTQFIPAINTREEAHSHR